MSAIERPAPSSGGIKAQVMSALRWSAIAKFGGQLVNWAITLVVIRLLDPSDYGLVAMLTIVFLFLSMLSDMGFGSSITQSKTLDTMEIRQTLGAALIVNLTICVALILAAPAIAAFYNEPRLTNMARVAALGFIFAGLAPVYSGLLSREMRFKTGARIEIASGIINNVATLVFALNGFGAWSLILAPLIANPVRIAMLMATAVHRYWPAWGIKGTRKLWSFGGNLLLSRILYYWTSQADMLIAAKFLGKEAIGFYSVAVHLASLPMQRAAGIINGVAFAAFAKIQHDPRAVIVNTRLGIRLMALVTFPVLWGIAAIAPELVKVLIGPNWLPAILPLTLVALTIPFRMIGSIVSTTIMSMGRVDIATVTSAVGAVVAPILFVIGSRHGIVGLSIAWLVVTPIMFMLNMFRALPILGLAVRDVFAEIWRPLVISGVMFLFVALLRSVLGALPDALLFVVLVMVGALVYSAGSWLLNRSASIEALGLLFPGRFARFIVPATVAP